MKVMRTIIINLLFLMFFPVTVSSQEQDFLNINSPGLTGGQILSLKPNLEGYK